MMPPSMQLLSHVLEEEDSWQTFSNVSGLVNLHYAVTIGNTF
jgi:hypothetical protein